MADILSLCLADTELRRVASTGGGEYAGPCPWCGGRDRFRVWPERGRYWCRGCGRSGDAIQYLRDKRGLSYQEACAMVGRTTADGPRRPKSAGWRPAEPSVPGDLWRRQAARLLAWAADQLWQAPAALDYLRQRGLAEETIRIRRLGYLPADRIASRREWGLPTDKGERLLLPAGIVIPCLAGDRIVRLRIRRLQGDRGRYFTVPGSCMGPMVLRSGREDVVVVVVESELDGLLLAQDCGDLAGVVALGSAQTRPDLPAHSYLSAAQIVLVALDCDEAGAVNAWRWWLKAYPQARRLPPVRGKDPGEMRQVGIDLRTWVLVGLQEYLEAADSPAAPPALDRLLDKPQARAQAPEEQAQKRCYNCGSSTWWRGDADSPWICYGCRPPYPWVRPGEVVGPPLEVRWEWSPSEGKMRLASGGE